MNEAEISKGPRTLLCCVCGEAMHVPPEATEAWLACLDETHTERCPGSPYANGASCYAIFPDVKP